MSSNKRDVCPAPCALTSEALLVSAQLQRFPFLFSTVSDGDGSVMRGRVRTVSDSVVIHGKNIEAHIQRHNFSGLSLILFYEIAARDELGLEQSRKRNNSESNTRNSDPKDDDDDDDDEEEDGADGDGTFLSILNPRKK